MPCDGMMSIATSQRYYASQIVRYYVSNKGRNRYCGTLQYSGSVAQKAVSKEKKVTDDDSIQEYSTAHSHM